MRNTDNFRVWTFFAIILLGVWLFVTPLTFSFYSQPLTVSNWICGALLIVFGDLARRNLKAVWIFAITLVGIWLQFTPLIFWAKTSVAYLNDTFVGSLVIFFALLLYPIPGTLPDEEPYHPPGWSYNPSGWPTRAFVALLAFICWMLSRYLAAYQLGYIETVWDPFFTPGTKAVLESTVSKAFPVPDAGLGAMAYTLETFSVFIGGRNRWRTAPWAVLIFGVLVIPVSLVSVLLIILQPLAVGAWCTLCLATAACMLIAIPFAVSEVAATLQYLKYSKEKPFLALLFQGGLCPKAKNVGIPPDLAGSLRSLWKNACSGVTFPWNLALSALVGLSLMAAPSYLALTGLAADFDPIAGALAAVVSVVSFAEKARKARFINCLFGLWVFIELFWLDGTGFARAYHGLAGLLLIALSFRKGPIYETSDWTN